VIHDDRQVDLRIDAFLRLVAERDAEDLPFLPLVRLDLVLELESVLAQNVQRGIG
jgi:hypothetical protein